MLVWLSKFGLKLSTQCHLVGMSSSSAIKFKTPQEVRTGGAPNYINLKVFGCVSYFHVNKGKLVPRTKKMYFVGYSNGVEGFKKCIIIRDMKL